MSALTDRIESELVRLADVHAAVEEQGDAMVLSGIIESEEQRLAAFDIVQTIAPDKRIIDNLTFESTLPERSGDFTEQPIVEEPLEVPGAGYIAPDEDEETSEGEGVYVPPMDPTRTRDNQVLGGFGASAMDDVSVERSSDGTLGESAIEEAVLRELNEDSATNGLEIEVAVRRGVVRLRGRVPDVQDVENAIEVASRVEGVAQVRDELETQTPRF